LIFFMFSKPSSLLLGFSNFLLSIYIIESAATIMALSVICETTELALSLDKSITYCFGSILLLCSSTLLVTTSYFQPTISKISFLVLEFDAKINFIKITSLFLLLFIFYIHFI